MRRSGEVASGARRDSPPHTPGTAQFEVFSGHRGRNPPRCGTYQNLFWDTRTGVYPWSGSTIASNLGSAYVGDVTQFHTYAVEWDASTMWWYVDDKLVKTQSVAASNMEEYRQGFFVILNLALAGSFPNTPPVQSDFPLFMYVDYVRVYQ